MRVNPVCGRVSFYGNPNDNKKRVNKYNMVPITGYTAFAGGLVSAISGVRHNMIVHRVAAMVSLAAAAAHIVLLKTMHGAEKTPDKKM